MPPSIPLLSTLMLSLMLSTTFLLLHPISSLTPNLLPYTPSLSLPTCNPPTSKVSLCNLPTPIFKHKSPHLTLGPTIHVKRDDATGGFEVTGNKLRKLEFLLADALENGHDTVITIGGVQSNHCRATVSSAIGLGLNAEVVLRTDEKDVGRLGHEGNLIVTRGAGGKVHLVTKEEYGEYGSLELLGILADEINRGEGRRPYVIPVGGSNAVGTWGYIEAAMEFRLQWEEDKEVNKVRNIIFTAGSGGTAAGIVKGVCEAWKGDEGRIPNMVAVCVCDNPGYFYEEIGGILNDMGWHEGREDATRWVRENLKIINGTGRGYAESREEEIRFISEFARDTGILLDPVYTGKSLYGFVNAVEKGTVELKEGETMFWHTGGGLGTFAKGEELEGYFGEVKTLI